MMTLAQCSIKLLNVEVSDTSKDHSSNIDDYIIINYALRPVTKNKSSYNNLIALRKAEKRKVSQT